MPTSGLVRARPPARRLDEVAGHLGALLLSSAPTQSVITGISLDSRAIQPGDLYAALPGAKTHGGRFAQDAAARGAAAILTDTDGAQFARAAGLPVLVVPQPREHLGELAAWLFGEPARQLTMYGVTGTNGKTTTTFLLDGALRRGGQVTGMIGTIQTRIGDQVRDSVRTTPEAPDVQSLLAAMVEQGASACSMEVSSHALALGRVDGIVFDVAGFTNLSQDHLDFHPTMEDYFAAKTSLFTPARARSAVICVDDAWGRRLADQATIPVVTLSTTGGGELADWTVTGCAPDGGGTTFTLTGPDGQGVQARCPLPGGFNVANTALAVVMLVQSRVAAADAAAWLAGADTVPGRMQPVTSSRPRSMSRMAAGSGFDGEPLAVVDYAHTPDAVAAAALALRDRGTPLVLVLGAGGDRDRQKRPRMGEAAASVADVVIVTDDNPRSEDPAAIRAAVLSGAHAAQRPLATGPASGTATVLEIPGRTAAIAEAVRLAWGGGTVLLAGKGHERGQEIAGVVHPFDDREVLAATLADEGMKRSAPAGAMNTEQGASRGTSVPDREGRIG